MAIRSIVDIDVNDEQFTKFQELWKKYHAELEDQPGVWAGVNKEMKSGFQSVAAALLAMQQTQRNINKDQSLRAKNVHAEALTWRDIAKNTKTFATNVKDATVSLLKWAGVTGIISGLIGGGGLFGLDLLAANVGGTRRSSLGLGVSYGEKQAFGLNFGRVVDSDAFLSSVNAATHDVTKRYALYGAGLNEEDLKGNTAQVSLALIQKLKGLADKTPQPLLAQTMQARGLDQFLSLEDFERLKNTPQSEIADYTRNFNRDKNALNLSPSNQRSWQDFQVQLSRAGSKIENVFVDGLGRAHIPEALNKLSDAVAGTIGDLMKSGVVKDLLDELGEGLKWLGHYIKSPEFKSDLKEFATDIGALAKGVVNALKWFGLIPDKDEEKNWKGVDRNAPLGVQLQQYWANKRAAQGAGTTQGLFEGWANSAWNFITGNDSKPDSTADSKFAAAKLAAALNQANGDSKPDSTADSKFAAAKLAAALNQANGHSPDTFESVQEKQAKEILAKFFPGTQITSEGRSQAHNDELEGSAKNSMHVSGQALDFVLPKGVTAKMVEAFLRSHGIPVTEFLNEGAHGKQGAHIHWGWRDKDNKHGSSPHKVEVSVNNNTGGNAVVSSSQLPLGYANFAGALLK